MLKDIILKAVKQRGTNIGQVAERVNINKSQLYNFARSSHSSLSFTKVEEIFRYLGIKSNIRGIIFKALEKKGMSINQLSYQLSIDSSQLYKFQKNTGKNLSVSKIDAILKHLDIKITE